MAFILTARGEAEAQEVQDVKGPEGAVIVYLYEKKDPTEIEEIMSRTKMAEEKAVRVLTRLVNTGFIEEI